jgi:DNA-binding transcriptional ArsR family regulator
MVKRANRDHTGSVAAAERNYSIPVSNGIFAHRKRIGAALWVFLWLIDHTTRETEAPDGKAEGLVHGGQPVPLKVLASDLEMSWDAVYQHLAQLEKAGYVRKIAHGNGRPNGYAVVNSKRFANRRTNSGRSSPETTVQKPGGTSVQNAMGTPVQKPGNLPAFVREPMAKSPSVDKEEVLQDKTRQEDNVEDEPITAEMVAQGVKQELGLGGMAIMLCLTDICRARLRDGTDPTKLRNDLARAWPMYKSAKARLTWTYGSPDKFFASDTWDDPALWPWKDGSGPELAGSPTRGYDSVDDLVAKLGGPRLAS